MRRLVLWVSMFVLLTPAGAVLGHIFGRTLYRISYDYIIVPSDFTDMGLRLGLLAGTFLAAAAVVGSKPLPGLWQVLTSVFLMGTTVATGAALGALLATILYMAQLFPTSTWQLAHPRRHAVCLGLQYGTLWGALAGTFIGGIIIARYRMRLGQRSRGQVPIKT